MMARDSTFRRGARALLGGVAGVAFGLPVGFAVYMAVSQLLLSPELWSSDAVMWAILIAVAGPFVAVGVGHGWRPGRMTSKLVRGAVGFLAGFFAGALVALGLSIAAAALFNISQMEGAYAMGVAFFYMPAGAILGGIIGTIWALRR